jgi:nicotinamidase-related amidase
MKKYLNNWSYQTMNDTALLIIDVQKGLFNRKTRVFSEEPLLTNISLLINRSRSNKIPVFFIQHSMINMLVKGSDDWQLHPALQPGRDDIFIDKCCASAFKETDLKTKLDKRKINKVIIMGIASHQCVRATCTHAVKLGYNVILAKDGHSSFNKNAAKLIVEWNKKLSIEGIKIKTTNEITFV